jgi:transcriptional regulator with XRE-family HTH domain
MSHVGERVKKRRSELEWTQEFLAQKVGISKSFLSDLENGKRSVSADNLLELAKALSLTLDYLMEGSSKEEVRKQVEIPASLAAFAEKESLTFRQALALLDMQQQIIAHRGKQNRDGIEHVDWRKFYGAVKEFL